MTPKKKKKIGGRDISHITKCPYKLPLPKSKIKNTLDILKGPKMKPSKCYKCELSNGQIDL
jgi:hypothetical protein